MSGKPGEGHVTPELLEWARQQFTEEEITAAIQDLRVNGGLALGDFLGELEEMVKETAKTYEESISWRLTRPLRSLMAMLRRP